MDISLPAGPHVAISDQKYLSKCNVKITLFPTLKKKLPEKDFSTCFEKSIEQINAYYEGEDNLKNNVLFFAANIFIDFCDFTFSFNGMLFVFF